MLPPSGWHGEGPDHARAKYVGQTFQVPDARPGMLRGREERTTLTSRDEQRGRTVTDHTYRITEIVGTSPESIDTAIRNGLGRARTTLRHLDWFEVTGVRGHLVDGEIDHFQVEMKVGFRLDDEA